MALKAFGIIGAILALIYVGVTGLVFFKQRSFIYFPGAEVRQPTPGIRIVKIQTADGLSLVAGYRQAVGAKPTFIAFHGNGADWQSMAYGLKPLVDDGFGILAVEYRGYQGNPGAPSEQGLYRDGRAALEWLAANGVPEGNVVAVGNSLGSGVALQLATETQLRGLILVSPVSSMVRLASARMPWLPVKMLLRDRYDNLGKLPHLKTSCLILHGDADQVIPIDEGRLLAGRNQAARFVAYPGAGHDLMYLPVIEDAIRSYLKIPKG